MELLPQDEPHDFGATTAVFVRVIRRNLTPQVLWSAIVGLISGLIFVTTILVRTQSAIHELNNKAEDAKQMAVVMQQQAQVLQEIRTDLAVLDNKVNGIADEVANQRKWRERIEDAAEAPPHPTRRRHP